MNITQLLELTKQLCVIPAPLNGEQARAQFCHKFLTQNGAHDAYIDGAFNVVLPINCDGQNDIVMIAAHTDTVFPEGTKLEPKQYGNKLFCPGVGDDTVHLAYLLLKAVEIIKSGKKPKCGLVLAYNSGEEGFGNLKGVRKLFDTYGSRVKAFISLDGSVDDIVDKAVGSHRYSVDITAPGGHSFNDFPSPGAIEAAVHLISLLYGIKVPEKAGAHTTYNVGTVTGGTSVNTIPQKASFTYEYRSDDVECLSKMQDAFNHVMIYTQLRQGVQLSFSLLGERPCGKAEFDAKRAQDFEQLKKNCDEAYGEFKPEHKSGSTDCNIPLSLGIPAVCVGIAKFHGAHTLEEYLEIDSLEKGTQAADSLINRYFE